MKELTLNNCEKKVMLDDEDYERLKDINFCAFSKGSSIGRTFTKRFPIKNAEGTVVFVKKKIVYKSLANYVMNTDGIMYDHKDRNSFNNQKYNLRPSDTKENACNRDKVTGYSSKYKGVSWVRKRRRWVSVIYLDTKLIFLGYFKEEIEAAKAYNDKAREIQKQFAVLNDV
jgi:hypothetical protein